jgi:hypothetical protein
MVSKEQIRAVCGGILPSFPDAESNPPRIPEHYFDSGPDVAMGCVPGRARSDLPRVATLGDWYLLIWSNEDLTAG